MNSSILVTGAGGFVGRPLVAAAAAAGWRVIATARKPLQGLPPGVESAIGDLRTLVETNSLPAAAVVVHAAATSPAPGVSSADFVRDNVDATAALADYCRRYHVERIVYLSSLSALGTINVPLVDETTLPVDPQPYGISKLIGEHLLAETGVPLTILRLPGVIGPGASRPWLARLVRLAASGQPLVISNPDGAFNNAVHVAQLVDFLLTLSAARPTGREILTLGANDTMTIAAIVERVRERLVSTSSIEYRDGGTPPFLISSRKAAERYGWSAMTTSALLDRFIDEMARV